jgi:hypothetical protein
MSIKWRPDGEWDYELPRYHDDYHDSDDNSRQMTDEDIRQMTANRAAAIARWRKLQEASR